MPSRLNLSPLNPVRPKHTDLPTNVNPHPMPPIYSEPPTNVDPKPVPMPPISLEPITYAEMPILNGETGPLNQWHA